MKKFDVMTFVDDHYYDDSDVVVGCCIEALPQKEPSKRQAPDWYTWRTPENGVCVFTSEGSVLDSLEKNVLLSKYI